MSFTSNISISYAKSIYELAVENKNILSWKEMMQNISYFFTKKIVQKYIYSSVFLFKELIDFFSETYFLTKYQKNFMKILYKNGHLYIFPNIYYYFEKYYINDISHIQSGTVYSTYSLKEIHIKDLEKIINKKLGISIKLINKINQKIIGGIFIQIGNKIIDISTKYKLKCLYTNLLK